MKDIDAYEGGGNIFTDLGLSDADEMLLKADLVARMLEMIMERNLTQKKAAEMAGMKQAELSNLLRGNLREYSIERLTNIINQFQ